MKVVLNGDQTVITLTAEELGTIRYALNIGTEKLINDADFHKRLNSVYYITAQRNADEANAVNNALEDAVQRSVCT